MDFKLIREKIKICEESFSQALFSACKHRSVRLSATHLEQDDHIPYHFVNKAGYDCELNSYCLKDKLWDKTVCSAIHAEEAFVHFCYKNGLQKEELPTLILCDYTPCNKCYRLLHDLYVDKGVVLTYVYKEEYRRNHNLWKEGSAVIEFIQYDDLLRVAEELEIKELIQTRIEKMIGFRYPFRNYEIDFSVKDRVSVISIDAYIILPEMVNLEFEYYRLLRNYVFKKLEPNRKVSTAPSPYNPIWVLTYGKEDLIKFLTTGGA